MQSITKANHTFLLMFSIAAFRHCNAFRGSITIMPLWLQNTHPPRLYRAGFLGGRVLSTTRKRRGLLRSTRAGARRTSDEDLNFTQYTIDDSICPPTNTTLLRDIVQKHIDTLPKYLSSKPIAEYNREAFEEALSFVNEFRERHGKKLFVGENDRVKVILDSGCGTGRSTRLLAQRFPDCIVIGIDRSLVRLNRNKDYRNRMEGSDDEDKRENNNNPELQTRNNVLLLRADLIDFWHLCLTSSIWQQTIQVQKHYLLYPNPYPKKARLKSRFYAHPAFPLLMLTLMGGDNTDKCDGLIVRSNWRGYLEEFALAIQVLEDSGLSMSGFQDVADISEGHCKSRWTIKGPERIASGTEPMTNFEAKYFSCGEHVYELGVKPVAELSTIPS